MNGLRMRLPLSVLGSLLWVLAVPLCAQFTTSGTVFGRVVDEQGKPTADATVTLASPALATPRTLQTAADGSYRFSDIPPETYTLTISRTGYETIGPVQVFVRVNSASRLDYGLTPSVKQQESVTVEATAPQIETTKSAINKYVSDTSIQNLPIANRTFLDVLNTVPGVTTGVPPGSLNSRGPNNSFNIHGARSNENNFLIDGVPNNDKSDLNFDDVASVNTIGGPRPSGGAGPAGATFSTGTALQTFNIDAIKEVQVSTSLFSAEFGNGSGGVINVVTKNGTDQIHGSAAYQHQSSSLVKDPPQKFHRDQEAVTVGGPVVTGDTHYFVSYERDDHNLGYNFNQPTYYVAPFLDGLDLTANQTSHDRATAKIDHEFGTSNTLNFTANYTDEWAHVLDSVFRARLEDLVPQFNENKAVGLVARDVNTFGQGMQLESVVNYTHNTREFISSNNDPRAVYSGVDPQGDFFIAATGSGGPTNHNILEDYGLTEKFSWYNDNRSWKVGAGVDHFSQDTSIIEFDNLSYGETPPPAPVQSAAIQPAAHFSPSLTTLYAFGQQDWYVTPKLTVNLGLRFDHDSLVGVSTVEPRLGAVYDLQGNGTSLLRAGFGIYHDRSNLIGVTGASRPPFTYASYDPTTGVLTPVGLSSETVVDPDLKLPITYKWIVGYEQQLPLGLVGGLTVFGSYNHNLFYTDNLNRLNNDANGTVPDPTHGLIYFYTNSGKSTVYDVELNIRRNFGSGSLVDLSYNYEHARGNSSFDFISGNSPIQLVSYTAQAPQPAFVSGPLDFEVRHNLKLSGVARLPWGVMASGILSWRTGLPFTVLQVYIDPQVGGALPEGYNSRRLPNYFNLDVRLAKTFSIGAVNVQIFADAFNVTNRLNAVEVDGTESYNFSGPVGGSGTQPNANFLKVRSKTAARSGQLGVRFGF